MVHIFHHLVVALIIKNQKVCAAVVVAVFSSDFLLVGDRLFMSCSDRGEIFLGFFRVCKASSFYRFRMSSVEIKLEVSLT